MERFFKLQALVLLAGTAFAWYTVYTDFSRFYSIYGSVTRIRDCVIPNPVTTPCFYGAFAFFFGLVLAVMILRKKLANRLALQKKLNWLLIAGTLFAWGNFLIEAVKFYQAGNGPKIGCSGVVTDSIFLTPCFYGSALFLSSLLISLFIIRRSRK